MNLFDRQWAVAAARVSGTPRLVTATGFAAVDATLGASAALAASSAPAASAGRRSRSTGSNTRAGTPCSMRRCRAASYRNPMLAGFYPDPSVTRAGDKFYLVNSTFAYFPGIPVFESTDLVHWKQVGNVIDRPSQLDFDGLGVSRGVFAPSIEYPRRHVLRASTRWSTAAAISSPPRKNPPGRGPTRCGCKEIDGIDPSLFFDDDGKAYVLNNGPPEGAPLYDGHRAIWMQEFDVEARQARRPAQGARQRRRRLLEEADLDRGPHLYKRDGWYYLMCAEGGTGRSIPKSILRGPLAMGSVRALRGQPDPHAARPARGSRRTRSRTRATPISCEGPDGSWWAIFLATRPIRRDHYNTGRETFLLPVTWRDGWPVILPKGETIPYVVAGPAFMNAARARHRIAATSPGATSSIHARLNSDVAARARAEECRGPICQQAGALTIHPLTGATRAR